MNILRRQRSAVYWESKVTEVRRCSWFHKGNNDGRYIPYEENIATMLEEEFKIAFESNQWHKKVELPSGETVEFHGPDILVLYPQTQAPDAWGNTPVSNIYIYIWPINNRKKTLNLFYISLCCLLTFFLISSGVASSNLIQYHMIWLDERTVTIWEN